MDEYWPLMSAEPSFVETVKLTEVESFSAVIFRPRSNRVHNAKGVEAQLKKMQFLVLNLDASGH